MSVGILLVTHKEVGKTLLKVTVQTLGHLPLRTKAIAVDTTTTVETLLVQLHYLAKQLNEGDGVLVLTDLFGATPNNLARQLQNNNQIHVISGLNLPMLIRIMNYPHLSLEQLAHKALSGGKDGIYCCSLRESVRTPIF